MLIPVQRAETFYLPPPPAPADAWALVPPAERCLIWYEHKQQRRIVVPAATLLGLTVWARIDANRWVADCPCGSAQVVTPADQRFACPECGAGWLAVVFPEDVAAAEQSVADDMPSERFWWNPDDPNPWNQPPEPPPVEPPTEGGGEA